MHDFASKSRVTLADACGHGFVPCCNCNVRTYSITALGTAAWVKHDLVTFLFNGMYVFVFNSF